MKKSIALTVILCLLLTACSGILPLTPERLHLDKAYKFTADIKHGEFNTVGVFERASQNVWTFSLLEPFPMEGLTMTYNNGEVTAEYEGLVCENAAGSDNAVYGLLISAFENAVCGEGREVIAAGEEIIISSKAGASAAGYEIVLDKKSLEPISLKMPSASLTVEFSAVQVSQIVPVIVPAWSDEVVVGGIIPLD
ncbi:MAG: hypothetical protein FWF82_06685 [Oscillospiraceae bacterium]|nr:hypothetical protein [Oscillospiraceae bacterium]